jgi:hypothetical protein
VPREYEPPGRLSYSLLIHLGQSQVPALPELTRQIHLSQVRAIRILYGFHTSESCWHQNKPPIINSWVLPTSDNSYPETILQFQHIITPTPPRMKAASHLSAVES